MTKDEAKAFIGETRYLGDGVYVSHDGYQIWLKTKRFDGVTHEIALDDDTVHALLAYLRQVFIAKEALR